MKSNKNKIGAKTSTALKISLSQKHMILLERFALLNDMTKKSAAKKIIKEFLAANVTEPEEVAQSQLDLFVDRETDLFDFTK